VVFNHEDEARNGMKEFMKFLFVLIGVFVNSFAFAGATDSVINCLNRGGSTIACTGVKIASDVTAVISCQNRGGGDACAGVKD